MARKAVVTMDFERLDDKAISQMFSDYIGRMNDLPRHTEATNKEVDSFFSFLENEYPDNVSKQDLMYDKAISVAIEFEESGFIAGFRTAIALLKGREELLPLPPINNTPEVTNKPPTGYTAIKTGVEKKTDTASLNDGEKYITSLQIAKMFGTQHRSILIRIESKILPELDEYERKGFELGVFKNKKHHNIDVYKLNLDACKSYIHYMSDFASFPTVKEGIAQLKELMQETFVMSPAVQPEPTQIGKTDVDVKVIQDLPKDESYITSVQIGEMFNTPNSKICWKIETYILKRCDEASKGNFTKEIYSGYDRQKFSYYRLNKAACDMYLIYVSKRKQFTNVVAGIAQLKELMKRTFVTEHPLITV